MFFLGIWPDVSITVFRVKLLSFNVAQSWIVVMDFLRSPSDISITLLKMLYSVFIPSLLQIELSFVSWDWSGIGLNLNFIHLDPKGSIILIIWIWKIYMKKDYLVMKLQIRQNLVAFVLSSITLRSAVCASTVIASASSRMIIL